MTAAESHDSGLSLRASARPFRRFRTDMCQTPLKYHLSLKLVLAQRLVQTTTGTVKEIAARTGFDDPLYFSRVFSREVGVSPRGFRAGRHQQEPG